MMNNPFMRVFSFTIKDKSSFAFLSRYRPPAFIIGGEEYRKTTTTTTTTTTKRTLTTGRYTRCSSIVKCTKTIADTPMGSNSKAAARLLDGLDVFTVSAKGDDHPLTVYGISSHQHDKEDEQQQSNDGVNKSLYPILLLHGRTWSSVPVFHLLGGPQHRQNGQESRSLMEALLQQGLQPYAMDFRGFGGTPPDATHSVEPFRCVADVESVLEWIAQRHSSSSSSKKEEKPALLGWSQGALVAQLVAQAPSPTLSKLILYGSIYDPLVRYPRDPLYTTTMSKATNTNNGQTSSFNGKQQQQEVQNTMDMAMEDFTIEGTIAIETAFQFAEAAMISDPIKAQWVRLYQFNNCDPARIHVPTLVVAGDQDPYAPLHIQQELFQTLGRGSDRTWSILADSDHAAHLLDGRARFATIVGSFVQNGDSA